MDSVLVVHENEDLRGVLERLLRKELGKPVPIAAISAYDGAVHTAPGAATLRLAVLGAAAPATPGGAPDSVGHSAIKSYLAAAADRRPDLTLVVLTTEDDDELRSLVAGHPRGRLTVVSPGSDWKRAIRAAARQAFGLDDRETIDTRRTSAILRIVVSSNSCGRWTMERRGRIEGNREGILDLDPIGLDDLCMKSEGLPEQFQKLEWGRCLPPVANDLYRLIFQRPQNQPLREAFDEALKDPGVERIRMIFGLSTESCMLPVETLKRYEKATNAEQWYALQSPLLRQYESEGPLEPLFWDEESRRSRIDCLLIAADARQGGMDLEPLGQVEYEVDDLEAELQAQKAAGANLGAIEVLKLGADSDEGPVEQRLAKALMKRKWKLVHFAGHAFVEPGRDDQPTAGRLVLRPAPDGVFDFAAFARSIPDARFLFVSSCRSAKQAFLQEVMKQSIPAVLGYRWPVKDDQARELSIAFYRALLSPAAKPYRSLGRALAFARNEVFRLYPSDVTWASPILLAKGSRHAAHQALQTASAQEITMSNPA